MAVPAAGALTPPFKYREALGLEVSAAPPGRQIGPPLWKASSEVADGADQDLITPTAHEASPAHPDAIRVRYGGTPLRHSGPFSRLTTGPEPSDSVTRVRGIEVVEGFWKWLQRKGGSKV